MGPRFQKILLPALTLLITLSVIGLGAEVLLRLAGREPWTRLDENPDHPVIFQPDATLGWRHKPGDYVFPPFWPRGPEVSMSLLEDGSRNTGTPPNAGPDTIVTLGGSFTEGFAISDHQTFSARIQQRFPEVTVKNFGTGAYGTYQSLLMLEEILGRGPAPIIVLYNFYEGHEVRNVATAEWLRFLSRYARRHGSAIGIPYATLDARGELLRHPPEPYPRWPLRARSATVTFLQDLYTQVRIRPREGQAAAVTRRLMVEMNRICEAHGVRFAVVLLNMTPSNRRDYAAFLTGQKLRYLDCALPLTIADQVPRDGHPNAAMNARWANCIAPGVARALERLAAAR
jgi:hypothetical protein